MLNPEEVVALIIKDLSDRKGIGNEWEAIDEDIQQEIRETWIKIVRLGESGLRMNRDE